MGIETPNNQENVESKQFENISSWDDLYAKLRELGGMNSSTGNFKSAEEIIEYIDSIRNNPDTGEFISNVDLFLTSITRSGGLRAKVEELLIKQFSK